jgi:peptidoglycan L-alanyl-D-glutamate endopeptidase CwlK
MPKFSQASFSKLATCHSDLQVLFYEVIKNYDCTILVGYRDEADQEAAFNAGKSKLHYPYGNHNKNPSMAVDVTPYPIDFNNTKLAIWFAGYVMGLAQKLKDEGKMTHAVRWGGSWDGTGKLNTPGMLDDLDHFELVE